MLVTRYRRAQGVPKCPASPAARPIAFMLLAVGSAHAQGSAPVPVDVQRLIGGVALLRTDHRSYGVPGEITKSRSWYYELFKKRFQLAALSGQVSDIKLRCDKKFVSFKHDPDLQYRVADALGECAIQVIGEPFTRFELIQS